MGGAARGKFGCTMCTSMLVSATVRLPLKGLLMGGSSVLCVPTSMFVSATARLPLKGLLMAGLIVFVSVFRVERDGRSEGSRPRTRHHRLQTADV